LIVTAAVMATALAASAGATLKSAEEHAATTDATTEIAPSDTRETGTLQSECAAGALKVCNKFQECIPAAFKSAWGTITDCVTRTGIACVAQLAPPGATATTEDWNTCAGKLGSATCAEFISGTVGCKLPSGTLPIGAPCGVDHQCQSSNCAVTNDSCGTCAPPLPGEKETCVDGCADSTLACVTDTTGAKTCVKRVSAGAACSDASPCLAAYVCTSSGSCALPRTLGQTCDATNATAPPCNGALGLYCSAGICVAYQFADAGAACGLVGTESVVCTGAAFCRVPTDSKTGTCVAPAPDGAPCDLANGPYCMSGASCSGGTCVLADPSLCK
jgi:hypothetical protein